jgi:hypothetical protein
MGPYGRPEAEGRADPAVDDTMRPIAVAGMTGPGATTDDARPDGLAKPAAEVP